MWHLLDETTGLLVDENYPSYRPVVTRYREAASLYLSEGSAAVAAARIAAGFPLKLRPVRAVVSSTSITDQGSHQCI